MSSQSNFELQRTPVDVARLCCQIAGYFHDVGKINEQFQSKIFTPSITGIQDFARHEMISAIIFMRVMVNAFQDAGRGAAEPDMIRLLAIPGRMTRFLESALSQSLLNDYPDHRRDLKELEGLMQSRSQYPVITSIMFLILSHHRLPAHSLDSDHRGSPLLRASARRHINKGAIASREANSRYSERKHNFLIDEASAFRRELKQALEDILEIYQQVSLEPEILMSFVSLGPRLSLILADRQVSRREEVKSDYDANTFYANTRLDDRGVKCASQRLDDHLIAVGKLSGLVSSTIEYMQSESMMPVLTPDQVPAALRHAELPTESPFHWQDDMIEKIGALKDEGIASAGFFGMMCSGTGSGKTRANAKMLAAMGDDLRYTLGVGLKTLTLQTYTEYLNDVGFSESQAGMLIGSAITRKLYDRARRDAEELGTSAEDSDTVDGQFRVGYSDWSVSPEAEELMSVLCEKERDMLLYPVVVCTVDHLMSITQMTRGKHLASGMRVLSSDLILDEVDSYSDVDLVSIGKLVYRTGMAGRRVVISSATTSPDLARALYHSYQAGYRVYCKMRGISRAIYTGWFCEFSDLGQVSVCSGVSDFSQRHEGFCKSLGERLLQQPTRRKGEVLEVSACTGADDYRQRVYETCESLHDEHHTRCQRTGIRVSCGMVKWNVVDSAMDFTEQILAQSSDRVIRTLCYHSRNMAYVLDAQSSLLNGLLNRKDPQSIFDHPTIRRAMDEASTKGVNDVMFVMSTTSIEEVGRDHDFDYAITEPSTFRSLVQMAGRVRRHRPEACHSANIRVLDMPVSHYCNQWGHVSERVSLDRRLIAEARSPKTRFNAFVESAWYAISPSGLKSYFDVERLSRIDARMCLFGKADLNEPLTVHEFGRRELVLWGTLMGKEDAACQMASLSAYTENPLYHTNDFHYNINPFRYSEDIVVFSYDEDQGWTCCLSDTPFPSVMADRLVTDVDIDDVYGRLILRQCDLGSAVEVSQSLGVSRGSVEAKELSSVSMSRRSNHSVNAMSLTYNIHLGARLERG